MPKDIKHTIIAEGIRPIQAAKYYALVRFSGQDEFDFAGLLLEQAINDAWEGYRNNPKHRSQIEQWEKENS